MAYWMSIVCICSCRSWTFLLFVEEKKGLIYYIFFAHQPLALFVSFKHAHIICYIMEKNYYPYGENEWIISCGFDEDGWDYIEINLKLCRILLKSTNLSSFNQEG